MKKIIAIPKAELDQRVRASADASPRKGNPHAPGRKVTRKKRPAKSKKPLG
jgi:hypothetical protein